MQIQRKLSKQAGFSLAELMVVIVILGLLATVVVPNVVGYLGQANTTVAKADIGTMNQAITSYRVNNAGRLPDSLEVLVQQDTNGHRALDAEEVPVDPWGNEYVYELDYDGNNNFRIISYGADGEPGGEGDNKDIDSISMKKRKRNNR